MSLNKIAIIDYGMGNLHSVSSALTAIAPDADVYITSDVEEICGADRAVFPGVGAMRDCIGEIKRLGIDRAVSHLLDAQKPLLAICVGMQSLMRFSEENTGVDCLAVLPGVVKSFSNNSVFAAANEAEVGSRLKVPHMGWNRVDQRQPHPLWQGIPPSSRFYFVHSYYVCPEEEALVAGGTEYGVQFAAALAKGSLFAVQFHPEKSHKHGLQLLKNFVHWSGRIN